MEYDLGKGHTVFSARIVPIHALSSNPGIQMTYSTSFCVMDTTKVRKLTILFVGFSPEIIFWVAMRKLC